MHGSDTNDWERSPDAPGMFRRRIKVLNIALDDIRIVRYNGALAWNYAADTRNFQWWIPSWKHYFIEFQRYNGIDTV